jgi:hypothetical protein
LPRISSRALWAESPRLHYVELAFADRLRLELEEGSFHRVMQVVRDEIGAFWDSANFYQCPGRGVGSL